MDLSETIHLVGEVLGEVLRAQESPELFETEERIRALAKSRRAGDPSAAEALASAVAALSIAAARATASSFAVYFDLVNLAEEAERIQLVDMSGFLEYWRAATPIDEISRLRLGSRPAARQGGALTPAGVRAIPWVFSWMQSRFNLPGWYGLGAGLARIDPERLRAMYIGWPFFRALLDNAEMSLLKADLGIAALYSDLVPDRALATTVWDAVAAEYGQTREAILRVSGHAELMDADPVIQRSVGLRNPYVDPLNYLQIEMLRRLRALEDQDGEEAERCRDVIVLTINGIAAGLRNTG